MDFERRILPFYMTYPAAGFGNAFPNGQQDADVLRDLEYFRQMYPAEIRLYQTRIAEILDKMDYEGSVIYDEYPDRYTLEHLAENITDIIRREDRQQESMKEIPGDDGKKMPPLIFVLLVNEVYKRRRGGRRGFFSFSWREFTISRATGTMCFRGSAEL